jgi:hypothetical protein
MTITSTDTRIAYAGDNTSTSFAVLFQFFGPDELAVYATTDGADTLLERGVHYTVTGGNGATGTVLAVTAPAVGTTWSITRATALTQQLGLPVTGPLPGPSLERSLDRLTAQAQETAAGLRRAIRMPQGEAPIVELPTAAQRANMNLTFNDAGAPIASLPIDDAVPVSSVMQPVLAAATLPEARNLMGAVSKTGDTMTGRLTLPSVTLAGNAAQMISPIANPNVLAVNPVSGETTSETEHEFLFSINYISSNGEAATVPEAKNKVALYVATRADLGSGNVWAFNPLLEITAGACAIGGSQIAEFDLANNSGVHFGDTAGAAGIVQPAVFGEQITGISSHRSTAASVLFGTLTDFSPMWNRGYVIGDDCVAQASFADYGQALISHDIRGSHSYGIDARNGVCTDGVLRLGNQQKIVGRNAADSADYSLLQTTSGDDITVGAATTPYLLVATSAGLAPSADNTLVLGVTGARWSAVWAANGTIQTSDPALKRDIEDLAGVDIAAIIEAIAPISYRWTDGGSQPVEVEHEEDVPVTELREWEETVVEVRNGQPTRVKVQRREHVPVFDTVRVVDEDGAPAFREVPASAARRDASGAVIRPARPARTVPLMHRVPRMERRLVKRIEMQPREGRRVHWGFSAAEVEKIADLAGRDFGGFVRAEDGTLSMRPDQMIPIVWEALRRLMKRVAALEAQ